MMRKEKKQKQEFCQSRFYKDWNPDIMADYNRWQKKSRFQNESQNICFHGQHDGQAPEVLLQAASEANAVDQNSAGGRMRFFLRIYDDVQIMMMD